MKTLRFDIRRVGSLHAILAVAALVLATFAAVPTVEAQPQSPPAPSNAASAAQPGPAPPVRCDKTPAQVCPNKAKECVNQAENAIPEARKYAAGSATKDALNAQIDEAKKKVDALPGQNPPKAGAQEAYSAVCLAYHAAKAAALEKAAQSPAPQPAPHDCPAANASIPVLDSPAFPAAATYSTQSRQAYMKAVDSLKSASNEASYKTVCEALPDAQKAVQAATALVQTLDAQIPDTCQQFCQGPKAFCLEALTGLPLCRKNKAGGPDGSYTLDNAYALPQQLSANDTIIVRVFGPVAAQKDGNPELTSQDNVSSDSVFPQQAAMDKGRGPPPADNKIIKLLEKTFTASNDAKVLSMTIKYKWTPTSAGDPVSQSYTIALEHGRYYLEIGLLVPLVINGSRRVTASTVPGTGGEKRLTVNNDSMVSPALALNFFPWGRRNGRVSVGSGDEFRCGDLFGFQFAVDINLKDPFTRIYGGVVLEPIAGFSLVSGLAAVKGDFVPQGYAVSMLVPAGDTFTPDSKYTPRPYFGLTLTNEILTTIVGAAQAIQKTKP